MKIEKLNPEEFGLQKAEATTIEKAFEPKIIEREALAGIYQELIKSELTPELCDEARALRLKLVKVRTGIADIHRTQKAFFLAAGRFVDAWKNKETEPVIQMEEKLSEIEKYYENLEKERKAKLRVERLAELEKYETDATFVSVEDMNDQVWSSYLDGVKYQYEKRKEAERKEEEERQRKAAAEQKQRARELEVAQFRQFYEPAATPLGEMTDVEYKSLISSLLQAKADYDKEQARIRKENETLRAQQEKQRKEREAEQKMLEEAKKERQRLEEALRKKKEEEAAAKEAEARKHFLEVTAPDKDKIRLYVDRLLAVTPPDVTDEAIKAIMGNITVLLHKIEAYVDIELKKVK